MATLFSHAVVAGALGQAAPAKYRSDWRFWCAAVVCSIVPDADVAGSWIGVIYDPFWGHRGITHSLLFALIFGILAAGCLRLNWEKEDWKLAAILFIITASHGILDAFTNGGRGVAFFSPFHQVRYFFPWRPVEVSPIGAQRFFTARGTTVILSELRWIWPASFALGFLLKYLNRSSRSDT